MTVKHSQLDGATFPYEEMNHESDNFAEQWIGRGSSKPQLFPLISSITLLVFYLWDCRYTKWIVLNVKIDDTDHLKWQIRNIVESVTSDILTWVQEDQNTDELWTEQQIGFTLNFSINKVNFHIFAFVLFVCMYELFLHLSLGEWNFQQQNECGIFCAYYTLCALSPPPP